MIFTERKITISNNASSIDKQIVLYRGDKNVEIRFTISEFPFKYSRNNETNVIESSEASFGQLIIKVPNDRAPIFSDIVATKKGSVIFTITGEMIDEISELGTYDFQIRLFDDEQNSRATIPPIEKGIEIREPIAQEDVSDTNEVGVATVGYALTTTAAEELEAFDEDGNYIQTTWGTGERITAEKLNKMEAGIDGVNKKVASGGTGGSVDLTGYAKTEDIPTKTSQLTNDSNYVTSTQMTDAINDAQLGGGTGGGISSTAKTLLISILRSAVFTSDQSANIDALNTALSSGGGSDSPTTQYTITNTLDNASTSNNAVLVDANASYIATITVNDGYSLDTITVTMGGTNITSSAVSGNTITISAVTGNVVITVTTTAQAINYTIEYILANCTSNNTTESIIENNSYTATIHPNSGYVLSTATITMGGIDITSTAYSNGNISIASVTGNVVITVNAIIEEKEPELVTDGLENYFDFRTATYNNSGAGGSTIISATQGNGSLYTWATNMVTAQDDYGMFVSRSLMYNANSVGTTSTNCGTTFTWIFKCYMDSIASPLFSIDHAVLSNLAALSYKPKYNKSSGTAQVTAENIGSRAKGYNTYIISVDGNICKLYKDASLLKTVDGSTISDFTSWYDKLTMGVLGSNASGHLSQVAVYNKALSEVEIVNMVDYLTTLEVK